MTSDARTAIEAYIASDTTDLLVIDAKRMPAGFPTGWSAHAGPLLVDPHTDWLAAGHGSEQFLGLAKREWEPDPFVAALVSGSDDDALVASVLGWQRRLGASGLISPYVRIEEWRRDTSAQLDRNWALATAAVRIARDNWPSLPVYAGIAVGNGTFKDDDRRDQVLEILTALKADGAYVVIEDKAAEMANYLEALADFGLTLKGQGLEAILAFAGTEAVALAASGSWDVLVTGHMLSYRSAQFQPQRGGNAGTRPARLLAHRYLHEVQEGTLRKVARVATGALRCSCVACHAMFRGGSFTYAHAYQGPHYYGSLHRWFRDLRAQPEADRKSFLKSNFALARTNAVAIDRQPPTAARIPVRHLRDWEHQLLS